MTIATRFVWILLLINLDVSNTNKFNVTISRTTVVRSTYENRAFPGVIFVGSKR